MANSKQGVMCLLLRSGFLLATLPVWQRWLSFWKVLPSPQRDYRVFGHLPDQGPSPPIAQFGRAAGFRKCLGGSKLLPFKNDGGHCSWRPSILQKCFGTRPQICASTQSCLSALRTIPSTSRLGFCSDMHCQLWDLI